MIRRISGFMLLVAAGCVNDSAPLMYMVALGVGGALLLVWGDRVSIEKDWV